MSGSFTLSKLARRSMARASNDYVSKDIDELAVVQELKSAYGLDHVYRFDIGKNTDGFSPLIHDVMETPELMERMAGSLVEYPENHYSILRTRLSRIHGVSEGCFALGAGLESVIDQICRAVLDPGDMVLVPTPNFDVFESGSVRVGAELLLLPACGDDLRWTEHTLEKIEQLLHDEQLKLVWISNPVNPTGQHIPREHIEQLTEATRRAGCFLVVDEAYGEYTDQADGVVSATRFLQANPQLMVLRTFSKIYCLPSARVGYMACSDSALREAVNTYRPMFPFSWISLYMAQLALLDTEHVEETRTNVAGRKARLLERTHAPDAGLCDYSFLDSDTNTIMFRHNRLEADHLHSGLARRGFLTANLNRLNGIQDQQYLRMTLHDDTINELFLQACAEVAAEWQQGLSP